LSNNQDDDDDDDDDDAFDDSKAQCDRGLVLVYRSIQDFSAVF